MIRRPLNERFADIVEPEIKTTTIRDKPWPVGVPIMLYHWLGKPYKSKQKDVCAVKVSGFWKIRITHHADGVMSYECGKEGQPLWQTEGFASPADMDSWFKPLVPQGKTIEKYLMKFAPIPKQ